MRPVPVVLFAQKTTAIATAHMPEVFSATAAHLLPPEQPVGPKGGRPRVVIRVIWLVLTTGARWDDVPPELACSCRTLHRRLRAWEEAGTRDRLHADLLVALRRAGKLGPTRWLLTTSP